MMTQMTQPVSVLFREIHKNAWLKRLPTTEKRNGAFPKKGERVWVVFCVHDDSEAFLELYADQKLAVTHKPDWFVSLNNCLHVSPTICAQEDEYEFVVTLSSDMVRLTAPSWEMMMEWVETIRSKLQEMRILSPRENLYSKMPEARLPLAPTRDPNSPLPPPPAGPSTLVPGIEPVRLENLGADGSFTSAPVESVSSVNESLGNVVQSAPSSLHEDGNLQVRSQTTALYITQSEPAVYTRPRHVLSRAASVPDAQSYSSSLAAAPCPSSAPPNNVTVIEVSSAQAPCSLRSEHPAPVFNFSAIEETLSALTNEGFSSDEAVREQVSLPSPAAGISETGSRSLRRTGSSSLQDLSDASSYYECVFLASEEFAGQPSPALAPVGPNPSPPQSALRSSTSSTASSVSPAPTGAAALRTSASSVSPPQATTAGTSVPALRTSASSVSPPQATTVGTSVPALRTSASSVSPAQATTAGAPVRRRSRSTSASEGGSGNGSSGSGGRLQPAPHPYRRPTGTTAAAAVTDTCGAGGGSGSAAGRLTLREQQVLQLRREMLHPGGVRLQLRRKDCTGSIALVEAFGAVWVAGWKQKEHPMLYNALHIGDRLLSVGGVLVQGASDAQKLARSATSLYVEFVIRRVPFGRVYAIRRDCEGQSLGIVQEGSTAEVRDVLPGSPAARQGLAPRAHSCDGLSLTNWVLTEINGRPLNLFFKDGEVRDRLNAVGREISILVQPSDLVKQLKKQLKAIRSYKDYIVQ